MLTVASCEVKPVPINYGTDSCHFCKMTIVDRQHAAQYVTKKGKQFKFDAVECMLNDLSENGKEHLALLLVSDYANPGKMTDAIQATYLISEEIKSPMGANLSSFAQKEDAERAMKSHGGELYSWEEMLRKYQVPE
jgi:copper chaperone NosL